MAHPKVLISKALRPIDTRGASAITVDEIASLNHEVFNHTMELASFVALCTAEVVSDLSGAVLTKVLGRAWDDVCKDFHFDTAQGFTTEGNVEEDDWVGWSCHIVELKSNIPTR